MEGLQSAFDKFKDVQALASSSLDSLSKPPPPPPPPAPLPPSSSYIPSGVLITRPPRNWVSLWTCSKLCAVFFVAGVFVGYTLKRRVRRWVSKLFEEIER